MKPRHAALAAESVRPLADSRLIEPATAALSGERVAKSQPLLRPAAGQGAFAETELLLKTPTVARTTTRVATPGEWRHALDLLAATAVRRDGAAAARHTEVRRRMRALARAARKFGRQP